MTITRRAAIISGAAVVMLAAAVVTAVLLTGGAEGPRGAEGPKRVAERIGCTAYTDTDTEELFVQAKGRCELNGKELRVSTFRDNTARDNWYDVASSFGGMYVVGDGFVVDSDDRSILNEVAAKLGAELK